MPFLSYIRNSLVLTLLIVPGAVLGNSMAGSAFASLPARGRSFFFGLVIATLAVPVQVTVIPTFLLFVGLGWTNSFSPLVIPQWTGSAIFIFLYRQFFRRLPLELYDSAELDGCSSAGIYWRIAMPLARPVTATVATFAFLSSWNDFQNPLIYLNDSALHTLPLGLALFQARFMTQFQYLMPMALLGLLPVLAVYLLAQRHIVTAVRVNVRS
jgi:multiple sugar transport system permease protein